MLLLLVVGLFLLPSSQGKYTVPSTCEPISVPICRSLPYNMTRLPNHLGHHTQKQVEAEINDYARLINASCSDSLVFLLCVYHLPICTMEFVRPILPCRSLCHQVKRDCMSIIRQFDNQRPRPDHVSCNDLPAYETGVCVKPESFVRHGDEPSNARARNMGDEPSNARARDMGACRRCTAVTLDGRTFRSKGYKFAIKAHVMSIVNRAADNQRIIRVNVRRILKEGSVKISRGPLRLHNNNSCPCPELKVGGVYLITGYEDTGRKALMVNKKSFAIIWKKKWFSKALRNLIIHWEYSRRRMKHNRRSGKHKSRGN